VGWGAGRSGSKTAEAKLDTVAGTTGGKEKAELKKPVRRLHVQSIRTIASNCQ
jgi:hypothetical protein